jgi:hypothetical protein
LAALKAQSAAARKKIEDERMAAVKRAGQSSRVHWGTRNAVIQRYETARSARRQPPDRRPGARGGSQPKRAQKVEAQFHSPNLPRQKQNSL